MPSSTSSFERAVPRGAWHAIGAIALVIFMVAMAAWEVHVRNEGYVPSPNDSNDLWARTRSRVSDDPGQTVIVGSSRILFDFDLATWMAAANGDVPVQLAMPGSNPLAVLEDVAATDFRGNLILGVTPGLWMAPEGPPVQRSAQAIGRFHNWSPAQRAGLALGLPLQESLAMINVDDLRLAALLGRLRLPNRTGAVAHLPPQLPPHFAAADRRRQARMWTKCDFGTPLALRIQQIWLPLFTPPPPPSDLSTEEFQARIAASGAAHLERIRVAVDQIRSRGGRVVFVCPPSTGALHDLEQQFTPRQAVWDRMLAVTGAPGIHFKDYPEMASFDCPEWSHLTAADAVRFSEALTPHLLAALHNQHTTPVK